MTALGIAITLFTALVLVIEFRRHQKIALPPYGWSAATLLVVAEILMFRGVRPISVYFTPIAWTTYIFLADAAVYAMRGESRMHRAPRELLNIALLSVPLWLIFEAYNLRLQNWTYVGVPQQLGLELLGYGWSFATITPGILETADLIEAFGWFHPTKPARMSRQLEFVMMALGACCLIVPVVVPQDLARYLFVLVWLGVFFLLDPMNHWLRLPSILGDFEAGRRSRFYSLLLSGFVCGWFWEFWNYWATAKWYYIFPMFQNLKIFEMPAPGFLGFLPFALECFVMCITAQWLVGRLKSGHKLVSSEQPRSQSTALR